MYYKLAGALLFLSVLALLIAEMRQSTPPQTTETAGGFTSGYTDTHKNSGAPLSENKEISQPSVSFRTTPRGDTYSTRAVTHLLTQTEISTQSIEDLFATLVPRQKNLRNATPYTDESNLIWDGSLASTPIIQNPNSNTRTTHQDALYDYGNKMGEMLTTFELQQSGQTAVLGDFFSGNGSSYRIARLADAYTTLAKDLARVSPPSDARTIHTRLREAYASVGKLLTTLSSKATPPSIDDVIAYNAVAESAGKELIALSLLFSSSGVIFSPSDPGRVFTIPDFPSQ